MQSAERWLVHACRWIPRFCEGLIRVAVFIAVAPLYPASAKADEPFESYRVMRSSVAVAVLRDAIGVLTIDSGSNGGRELQTYRKRGEFWVPYRRLDAGKTVPISDFGYQPVDPEKLIANFRYPITKHEFGYVEIVLDPVADKRLWVNSAEVGKTFYVKAEYFAHLGRMQGTLIDPFFGGSYSKRRVFMIPDLSAESLEITDGAYSVREERNGFLLLVPFGSMDDPPAEPVGWLPIRDADGLLTIWLILVDNC
jgi:hypothetical protein